MTDSSTIGSELRQIVARADALMELERWGDAIRLLLDALRLAPDSTAVLCRLSLNHLNLGDAAQSLACADRAVASDPESEWAHRLRSLALSARSNYKAALAAASECVRLDPDGREGLHTLSEAQRCCGQYTEARRTAERLLAVAPEWSSTFEILSVIASSQKRWRDMESYSRKALALNPNAYYALNNIGVALLNMNRKAEAIEYFEAAARLRPDRSTARDNLKVAVKSYLKITPAIFIVAWIVIQAARINVGVAIFGSVVLAAFVLGRRLVRRHDLSPTVQRFIAGERRKSRAEIWSLGMIRSVAPAVGILALVAIYNFWALTVLFDAVDNGVLWMVLYLIGLGFIGAVVWMAWQRWKREG